MLEKLQELSIALWKPIGDIFYYLFESSGIWLPIILFFLGTFLLLFVLRKILDTFVELPLIKIFKFFIKFSIKIILLLMVIGVFVSLAFYIQSLYVEYDQEVVQKEQSVDYLLH